MEQQQENQQGVTMEEQNQLLQSIIDEIDIWQRRPQPGRDRCCEVERERGFQEGLRLSGAIVRARLIKIEEDQE
jgi:hypothetical protein